MPEMNALNPALVNLLQVASMVTPDQTPTVAAQVVGAATQQPAPMQGGMPPQGEMPPGMRDITQDAMMGNQVQMHQQQQEQQAMQQMLQQLLRQQQGQDNAMRFGVAAAPGAQNVRMAEGGIVGYAGAGSAVDPLDMRKTPETVEDARKLMKAREAAAAAAKARPVMQVVAKGHPYGRALLGILGLAGIGADDNALDTMRYAYPIVDDLATKFGIAGPAARGSVEAAQETQLPAQPVAAPYPEPARIRESQPSAAIATAGTTAPTARPRPVRQPAPAQAGIGALVPQQPMGPRASDAQFGAAQAAVGEMETAAPSSESVLARTAANQAVEAGALRAAGLDPEQYKRDIEASQAREARKLQGLGQLEARVKESRTGIDGLIRLLSSASGRTDPLAAIGAQYGRNVAQDLAEDERFMRARDQAMDAEEAFRMAVRDRRAAEVRGDVKGARQDMANEQKARNEVRTARANMAMEAYKVVSGREERALDRDNALIVAKMSKDGQMAIAAAQQAGASQANLSNNMTRLAGIKSAALSKADAVLAKRENEIRASILPGQQPTAAQQKDLQDARLQYTATVARIEAESAKNVEALFAGGKSSGITVTPLPEQ